MAGQIIKASHLTISSGGAVASPHEPPSSACSAPAAGNKPKLVLHRNDVNDIEAVEITCTCGHTIIIECEYEGESS